ncbi:MAG: hypothetical protein ACRYFX_18565 [Janthinobacterium lividum]
MAKVRTAEQNRDFYLGLADQYDREAEKHVTAGRYQHWKDKAAEARQKAATYTA